MGLNAHFLELMIYLKENGFLNGRRVMELGAQQLSDPFLKDRVAQEKLASMFGKTSCQLPPLPSSAIGLEPDQTPHSRPFFEALGYEYACIDVDGTPDALMLDLNYDEVPIENRGRYDLVTNFGTTEHVLNQLNAFKIIHDLTVPGGVMIHELPAQGLIDHGFFAYNPKFFHMLGSSNHYETLFFDFRWTEIRQALPPYVVTEIEKYLSTVGRPLCGISEAALFVAHRKSRDSPFAAPLDVPAGALPMSSVPSDRYYAAVRLGLRGRIEQSYRLIRRIAGVWLKGR
jgi:hypothetical protein